jgi:hypothetical protein
MRALHVVRGPVRAGKLMRIEGLFLERLALRIRRGGVLLARRTHAVHSWSCLPVLVCLSGWLGAALARVTHARKHGGSRSPARAGERVSE